MRDQTMVDDVGREYQIPPPKPKKKPGRPRMDDRKAMNAIFYILRTGCQWKAIPRSSGAPSTVHDRFQEWRKAWLFEKMWKEGLMEYEIKKTRLGEDAFDVWSHNKNPFRRGRTGSNLTVCGMRNDSGASAKPAALQASGQKWYKKGLVNG